MIADVMTSELTLGGVYDFIEVFANNHRTRCHIQPVKVVDLYSPDKKEFAGMDLMEKISSNEGWIQAYPEFGWSNGQSYEMRDFTFAMQEGRQPECNLELAIDITLAIYAGYVSADRKGGEVDVADLNRRRQVPLPDHASLPFVSQQAHRRRIQSQRATRNRGQANPRRCQNPQNVPMCKHRCLIAIARD